MEPVYMVGSTGRKYYPSNGDVCTLRLDWVSHHRTAGYWGALVWWGDDLDHAETSAYVVRAAANYGFAYAKPDYPQRELYGAWRALDAAQEAVSEQLRADLWRETHWLTKPDAVAHAKALGFKLTKSGPGYFRTECAGLWLDFRKGAGSGGWYPCLAHFGGNAHCRADLERAVEAELASLPAIAA